MWFVYAVMFLLGLHLGAVIGCGYYAWHVRQAFALGEDVEAIDYLKRILAARRPKTPKRKRQSKRIALKELLNARR